MLIIFYDSLFCGCEFVVFVFLDESGTALGIVFILVSGSNQ